MADRSLTPRFRRKVAAAVLLVALALLAWLAAHVIEAVNHPTSQAIEAAEGEATIQFAADRTRFAFPGDCSTARWEVGGIRAVHFYTYPVTGAGEYTVCHGDAPYLRVRLQDESERVYRLDRDVLFLRPAVTGVTLVALGMGAFALYLLGVGRWLATERRQYLAALLAAFAWVVILDLFTNSAYIIIGPSFDAARTLEIARNGWLGNPNVLAPWAYRPVTPLLARDQRSAGAAA